MIILKIKELISAGKNTLQQNNVPDADYDAWELLAFVTQMDRLSLHFMKEDEIGDDKAHLFLDLISRRASRFPLQYIEGEAWFMGLPFCVTPSVLIPRQDTETLAEEVLSRLPAGAEVLDLGTGSGAIAISLKKKRTDISVTAADISDSALEVAKKNAARNSVSVEFVHSDCFSGLANRKYDVIVSNPPYISEDEMKELMPEVCFEPENALFGGADGLDFYRKITTGAFFHLKEHGLLIYEIGWKEKDAVCDILRSVIGEPFSCRDLNGNWRVAGAYFEKHSEVLYG